jgi:hypothetical protein
MDTCDKLKIKLFLVIFPNFSAECDGYYDRILNLSNKKVIIINYERKNYDGTPKSHSMSNFAKY